MEIRPSTGRCRNYTTNTHPGGRFHTNQGMKFIMLSTGAAGTTLLTHPLVVDLHTSQGSVDITPSPGNCRNYVTNTPPGG